jgi:hypothetical protein
MFLGSTCICFAPIGGSRLGTERKRTNGPEGNTSRIGLDGAFTGSTESLFLGSSLLLSAAIAARKQAGSPTVTAHDTAPG